MFHTPRLARLAFVFAAAALAFSNTAHAYQLKTTKTGAQVRWADSTITLHVDAKLDQLLGSANVRDAVGMASDAWRGLPGVPDIVISNERPSGYRADQRTNGVYLIKDWPYEPEQLAVTLTTYDMTGRVLGVDVLVNGQHKFILLNEGTDKQGMEEHDIGAVLTHEFGHVLGLGECPNDQSATMWPYIRGGEVHQRSITADDEQGVIAAYAGAAPGQVAGCTQASVVGAPSSGHAAGLWLSLLGFGLVLRTRRTRRAVTAA